MWVFAEIEVGVCCRHECKVVPWCGYNWVLVFVWRRGEGEVVCDLVYEWVAERREESASGSVGWTCATPGFPDVPVVAPVWDEWPAEHGLNAFGGILESGVGMCEMFPRNEDASLGFGVDRKVHVWELQCVIVSGEKEANVGEKRTLSSKLDIMARKPWARALTSESS